jgi:hypothetical protein
MSKSIHSKYIQSNDANNTNKYSKSTICFEHHYTESSRSINNEKIVEYQAKKIFLQKLNEYKSSMKQFVMTSRFNTITLHENRDFVKKQNNMKCVYCSPDPIAKHIPIDALLFVLEMNNDTNLISGIGLIRNHAHMHKYSVYTEQMYNRYIYYGKQHIARTEMTENEERIMKVFDILCFTGNKHMKRGQGIKSFPVETLYKCSNTIDLVAFIGNMFKSRMK